MSFFKSEAVQVVELLQNNFFRIPLLQREYVWERENVETLLTDIKESFERKEEAEYFIGGMVFSLVPETKNLLVVIDGQQRLTTLLLVLSSILSRFETDKDDYKRDIEKIGSLLREPTRRGGETVSLCRLELQGQHKKLFEALIEGENPSILNPSVSERRLKEAKDAIDAFIEDQFSLPELSNFFWDILQNVYVVRTVAASPRSAFRIFETLNYRAVPLEAADLLKNLLLQHVWDEEYDDFEKRWVGIIRKLSTDKGRYAISASTFLRHFIMSTGQYTSKEGIYDWFKDGAGKGSKQFTPKKVNELLGELEDAVTWYRDFTDGKRNNSIAAIKTLGLKQCFIILLAARKLSAGDFENICECLEKMAFAYYITGNRTNLLEDEFCKIAQTIQEAVMDREKVQIAVQKLRQFCNTLKEDIPDKLRHFHFRRKSNEKKVRYMLEKMAHALDGNDYSSKQFTIEHIFPEDINKVEPMLSKADKENYAALVTSLGNLTLLTHPDNSSLKNEAPDKKWPVYNEMQIRLTRSLCKNIQVPTKATIYNKAINAFNYDPPQVATWGSQQIQERTEAMIRLVMHIWFS